MSLDTISIIIPAHNAAATIDRTLRSVADQSSSRWNVVVVDDGSTDATAALVRTWSERDDRITMVQQQQAGVSAARNAGLRVASGRWVLFLDADDVITAGYFAAAVAVLDADPRLGGVRCRWSYESSTGLRSVMGDLLSEPGATLRSVSVRTCPLAMHACIVAKSVVESVGGFDEALAVGEDWDLWNRVGRTDVRLGVLDEPYAVYVLRAGSASRRDFVRVHADCAAVLRRTADGTTDLDALIRENLVWVLAIAAGAGGDVAPLLASAGPFSRLDLDTSAVAEALFSEAPLGGGFLPEEWPAHWNAVEPNIRAAVAALTVWVGDPDAARPILRRLELRVAEMVVGAGRVRIGATLTVPVELDSPIEAIDELDSVEQVVVRVCHGATPLGIAEVAVFDDVVTPAAIHDAIRHQLAPSILRAARQRPRLLLSVARPLAPRTVAHESARMVLDLPGHTGEIRRELIKNFARTVVDSSTRGATAYEVPERSTEAHRLVDAGYWEDIFADADPWSYSNTYEQRKYEQTLSLLTGIHAEHVLELACAEGHFTAQLAPLVGTLVATDISSTALERAAERCADHPNIEFRLLDLTNDALPTDLDVIVCSEVLYYYDRSAVEALAVRMRDALRPGGVIVSAHANLLTHEPHRTGFDWGHAVTGKVVRDVFASTPGLVLERELGNDLYRIMRFRRAADLEATTPAPAAERVDYAEPLDPMIARMVVWGGFTTTREQAARDEMTDRLPVLMYHRIAEDGSQDLARYRTSPAVFEQQLAYLRKNGYYGITLQQWWYQISRRQPLDGRAVLLTFDDGYSDFYEHAWPLLDAYKFPATVFIVADAVGGTADWDSDLNDPPPLLDWPTIRRLAASGIDFGSHSGSHRALTGMSPSDALAQERAARATFERELGQPVSTIAYPYGAADEVVRQTMRAAGYQIGVETSEGMASVWDDPMAIPRREVRGDHNLEEFAALLGEPTRRNALRKGLRSARRYRRH